MKNFKSSPWLLPQMVLVVGTYDSDGTPNAMNVAWAGQADTHEIIVAMGQNHATTENLARCLEFTVAFATVETMKSADYVGVVSGKKVHDKVAVAGWKSTKAEHVNAPVFDCFPMTMECRIRTTLYKDETVAYLAAEIVNILCDEAYLAEDGKPDVEKMHLITFDPCHNGYLAIGKRVGNAFKDGLALK